jgi:hypothetical protein
VLLCRRRRRDVGSRPTSTANARDISAQNASPLSSGGGDGGGGDGAAVRGVLVAGTETEAKTVVAVPPAIVALSPAAVIPESVMVARE